MTKLQTGLKRVQDMTDAEKVLHYKLLFYKADVCISDAAYALEDHDTHASMTCRVDEALDIIRRYGE